MVVNLINIISRCKHGPLNCILCNVQLVAKNLSVLSGSANRQDWMSFMNVQDNFWKESFLIFFSVCDYYNILSEVVYIVLILGCFIIIRGKQMV